MPVAKQVIEPHPLGFHMWRNLQWAREVWWVITGRWSLHRAWQSGHDHGTQSEYRRIITNKGEIAAQRTNAFASFEQQARRVRNYSKPDEVFDAVPLKAIVGEGH